MIPQFKKGFTLIELMIVVAIIGVLAVTIVPALTGAQARARDAGRVASMQNISAVLETYFADNGAFPTSTGAGSPGSDETGYSHCISNKDGVTATAFAPMFKGGHVPVNPQKTSTSGLCAQQGSYGYTVLTKDGVAKAGYLLVADIESWAKANSSMTGATEGAAPTMLSKDGFSEYKNIQDGTTVVRWGKLSAEATGGVGIVAGAKGSVYSMMN